MSSLRYYKHGSRRCRSVALTFDDGPTPGVTEEVITILKHYDVRATFFMIGRWSIEPTAESLVRMIARAGHTIGNHSHTHLFPSAKACYGANEFADAERVLTDLTGVHTKFVRLPYCTYRQPACRALDGWIGHRTLIDGDVWSYDWVDCDRPDKHLVIAEHVLQSRALAGGSVIVFHDGSESETTRFTRPLPMLRALPTVIEGLVARQFRPVPLDEMRLEPKDAVVVDY